MRACVCLCVLVCVQSYAHRQLCPCGFSTAFFGPAPVTQIHSEITTRSRVELSSKSAALSQVSREKERGRERERERATAA